MVVDVVLVVLHFSTCKKKWTCFFLHMRLYARSLAMYVYTQTHRHANLHPFIPFGKVILK